MESVGISGTLLMVTISHSRLILSEKNTVNHVIRQSAKKDFVWISESVHRWSPCSDTFNTIQMMLNICGSANVDAAEQISPLVVG